jgi:hypothetical protein
LQRDIEDERIVFWSERANIHLPIPFRASAFAFLARACQA